MHIIVALEVVHIVFKVEHILRLRPRVIPYLASNIGLKQIPEVSELLEIIVECPCLYH